MIDEDLLARVDQITKKAKDEEVIVEDPKGESIKE
jgi:hypothetical protein